MGIIKYFRDWCRYKRLCLDDQLRWTQENIDLYLEYRANKGAFEAWKELRDSGQLPKPKRPRKKIEVEMERPEGTE